MKIKATTVKEYVDALPADRQASIQAVRKVILRNLPRGYEEVLQYGMLGYVVPLKAFPAGYLNRKNEPLPYLCLASEKNYMTLHLMSVYGGGAADEFRKDYEATGKRLDMGKACIRFKKAEDLALGVIGKAVARWPMKQWVSMCETAFKQRK